MNGAIAVPSVKTINVPKRRRKKTIGASQNFFRTFKNSQISDKMDNLDIHIILYIKIVFRNFDLIPLNYHDSSSKNWYSIFSDLENLHQQALQLNQSALK